MGWTLYDKPSGIASGLQNGLAPRMQIQPIFHIDLLKQYVHSEELLQEVEPPSPILVEDHLEYEVQDLIQHHNHDTHLHCLML